jgi:hypothetical protein
MRSRSEKKVIGLIREQFESRLFSTLLEMDVIGAGGKVMVDAGLEVTNKKTKQKFTVQSVSKDEGGAVKVSLISPENVTGPITSTAGQTIVSPGQSPQVYTIDEFERDFEV